MKTIIKKLLEIAYGSQDIVKSNMGIASLVTGIIFAILIYFQEPKSDENILFIYISATSFCLWLIFVHGANTFEKILMGLTRLIFFFTIFIFSIALCLSMDSFSKMEIYFWGCLSFIGILTSSIYFVSKFNDIFDFIKKLFYEIKSKLFNSDKPATSKPKALIENITAFLVSIGSLAIAIKVITESIFQILDYFKK